MTVFLIPNHKCSRVVGGKFMSADFMHINFRVVSVGDASDGELGLMMGENFLGDRVVFYIGFNQATCLVESHVKRLVESIVGDKTSYAGVEEFLEKYAEAPPMKIDKTHQFVHYVVHNLDEPLTKKIVVPGLTDENGHEKDFLVEPTDDNKVYMVTEYISTVDVSEYGFYTNHPSHPPSSWNKKLFEKIEGHFVGESNQLVIKVKYYDNVLTFKYPRYLRSPAMSRIWDTEVNESCPRL